MSWIERSEKVPCCPDASTAVNDDERIARLLHSKNSQPFQETFRREELLPPKGGHSNECGLADGFSVTRALDLSDDILRRMAADYASERDGRHSSGAIVAMAHDLRAIRKTGDVASQVVYLYDDPTAKDPMHAVIRVVPMDRPDFSDVKDKIGRSFNATIIP
jgi:hypothetical protein